MDMVLLTALGVGGATVVGAGLGFLFKNITHKFSDIAISFAAGIMLCAAVIGLILPSLDYGVQYVNLLITAIGVIVGAIVINLADKFVPHLHKLMGTTNEDKKLSKILLFVLAIAIHNLPEGLAAGVSFGSENINHALVIAGGIALQNIPEGMVIIAPMLSSGVSKGKTFFIASLTGVIEVIGTLIGYFASSISAIVLPFALAFAGGAMLYVISHEMIPETHAHGYQKGATYSLIIGFLLMLIVDFLLG